MKKMEEPKVELVELGEDIITSSGCTGDCVQVCSDCKEVCDVCQIQI